MTITKKELNELKREVKNATGNAMKDIEIEAFGKDFIEYSYYKTNYDKVANRKSYDRIER